MDIKKIEGIGKAFGEKLKKVGITTVEKLREIDIKEISKKSGINPDTLRKWRERARELHLLSDLKGIGPTFEEKLKKAGITNAIEMAKANAKLLAKKTGISINRLKRWIQEAEKMMGELKPKEKLEKVARFAEEALEDATVYIKEGARTAKVKIGEKWHEQVPVIRKELDLAKEEVKRAGYNIAVHVRKGRKKARIWLEGKWREVPVKKMPKGLIEKIKEIFGRKK